MTPRLNVWLLTVLLIIAIPYYWWLLDPGVDPLIGVGSVEARAKPVTMVQLRTLAASLAGERPSALRVETIGWRYKSRNMRVAGTGLLAMRDDIRAYELVVPGSGPIVIDAGTPPRFAQEHGFEQFYPAAQARVEQALSQAGHAILLADKPAHNGGHASHDRKLPTGGAPYALAPGVVVIPAGGLPHATTMVYARMADGREYLFTGDVARMRANWAEVRPPARLAMPGAMARDRGETLSWLMTINALHRAAPQMAIVAGHDPARIPFSAGPFSD